MEIQRQDGLELFFVALLLEEEEVPVMFLTSETLGLAGEPELPLLLFESDKSLFDLALANGFRVLGAE